MQFNSVLLTGGKDIKVGDPLIKGAGVQATVIDQIKIRRLFHSSNDVEKALQRVKRPPTANYSSKNNRYIGGGLIKPMLKRLRPVKV